MEGIEVIRASIVKFQVQVLVQARITAHAAVMGQVQVLVRVWMEFTTNSCIKVDITGIMKMHHRSGGADSALYLP